jgi:hypothetical protein
MAERLLTYAYLSAFDFNVSNIVLEYSWDVDFWELVLRKYNQKAGLATGSVSDNN